MRTLLVSIGTSLLTNQGWKRGEPLPDAGAVLAFLKQSPTGSAETNTLMQLPLEAQDRLVFLYSDTEEGERCAQILALWYADQVEDCKLQKIKFLNYDGRQAERGLRELLDVTFGVIQQARRQERKIIICATGGFKSEIAFLNLVGMLMSIPVCYLHEQFRDLFYLPALPIDWQIEFVAQREAIFRWIDEELRTITEAESRLKADPDMEKWTIREDEHIYLSAAGDLLYRAYQNRQMVEPPTEWPPTSSLAPDDKKHLSNIEHHRPDGWDKFVDDLARLPWVTSIRYDSTLPHNPDRTRIHSRDEANGKLFVLYCRGDETLPLCVETTARGAKQLDLVAEQLNSKIRKR